MNVEYQTICVDRRYVVQFRFLTWTKIKPRSNEIIIIIIIIVVIIIIIRHHLIHYAKIAFRLATANNKYVLIMVWNNNYQDHWVCDGIKYEYINLFKRSHIFQYCRSKHTEANRTQIRPSASHFVGQINLAGLKVAFLEEEERVGDVSVRRLAASPPKGSAQILHKT